MPVQPLYARRTEANTAEELRLFSAYFGITMMLMMMMMMTITLVTMFLLLTSRQSLESRDIRISEEEIFSLRLRRRAGGGRK